MRVLGCDCSTKLIGCSMITDKDIITATIYGGNKNDTNVRAEVMYQAIKEILDAWEPEAVYIEQAVYLQNVKVTLTIDAVVNGVRYACIDKNIPYFIIDNKSWKKDVLGNGNSSKEDIAKFSKTKWGDKFNKFSKTKWGDKFKTQDEMDACCLAYFGYRRLNKGEK